MATPPRPALTVAALAAAAAGGAALALCSRALWSGVRRALPWRSGEARGTEEEEEAAALVDFAMFVQRIKGVKRTGWVRERVHGPESVGDHMYSMGVLAMLIADADPTVDRDRCVRMALVHDLAEAIVGDITPFDGVPKAEKQRLESEAMHRIVGSAKRPRLAADMLSLWREYDAGQTPEARLVKDIDKLEMIATAHAYETAQQIDLEGFFRSTEGRIRHPVAAAMSAELRSRRRDVELPVRDSE